MKRPLILAHGYSSFHGRENSVEFIRGVEPFHPDIIELDIRRSRDGVLFCHHGFIPFGVLIARFLRYLSFSIIRKYWGVNTLQEVLAAVREDTVLYLDLKQKNISGKDLEQVLSSFCFKTVIFQSYSLSQVKSLQNELGEKYKYVYNWGISTFRRALRKIRGHGLYGSHLFWWQCSRQNIQALKDAGLEYWLFPYLISRKKYLELSKRWSTLAVAYDDLREVTHFLRDSLG